MVAWERRGGVRKQWEGRIITGNLEDDRRFIILTVVIVSRVYTYVKTYQNIHLKYVQFILCYLQRDMGQRD